MKLKSFAALGVLAFSFLPTAFPASLPNTTAHLVVTLRSSSEQLAPGDVTVVQGNAPAPVVSMQRLSADLADLQLFVLLDDSTSSSSLGTQIPELKKFLGSLPPAAQVAVGYMHNGTFALSQPFTTDHAKAADAVRLPHAIPGENGSPYFVLSDLVNHWPSKEPAGRRAVLMLTDGVDRYDNPSDLQDPYVDAAITDSLKHSATVYSIYLRGAGRYGRSPWGTNFAQSRLLQVSDATGGYSYFQDIGDPVTIAPFLADFTERLENQYLLTIQPHGKGVVPVKLRTETPSLKLTAPTRIYVP